MWGAVGARAWCVWVGVRGLAGKSSTVSVGPVPSVLQRRRSPRMVSSSITSDFSRGPEDWVAEESGRPTTSSYNAYQVRVRRNVRVEMFVFRDW